MKLKISIHGYGAEIAVNEIPKKVYEYIQNNFGGSIDDYVKALDNGEVPDEYSMVDGTRSGFVSDGDYHAYGASIFDALLTVENEDTGAALLEAEDCNKYAVGDPYESDDARVDAKAGKHFVLGQSIEKGYWNEWHIDTKGKRFSKKKLKVLYETFWFNNEPYVTIDGIKYDGEFYDEGYDVLSIQGKAFNLKMI